LFSPVFDGKAIIAPVLYFAEVALLLLSAKVCSPLFDLFVIFLTFVEDFFCRGFVAVGGSLA
jgi:hypothetical protein